MLAIWGGSYLYACVLAISGPGRALNLALSTRGGVVTLRADAYAFDLAQGVLLADDASLADPHGNVLGRAREVFVRLPAAFGGKGHAVDVRLRGVQMTLVREPDGRIPLLDFLPEKTEEVSEQPVSVELEDLALSLVDRTSPEPWRKLLRLERMKVAASAGRWHATFDLLEPGKQGVLAASVRGEPNGTVAVEAEARGFDFADYARHLGEAPEGKDIAALRELRAASAVATGPVAVLVPAEGEPAIRGKLAAKLQDVAFRKLYTLDSAEIVATFDGLGGSFRVDASADGAMASAEGTLAWREGVRVAGSGSVEAPSRAALPDYLAEPVPPDIGVTAPKFAGVFRYSEPDGLRLQGDLSASAAEGYGERVAAPHMRVALSSGRLVLSAMSGTWHSRPILGGLEADLDRSLLRGAFQVEELPLGPFAARAGFEGIEGVGRTVGIVAGTFEKPEVSFRAEGLASYSQPRRDALTLGRFSAEAKLRGEKLIVQRATLFGDPGAAAAWGEIDLAKRSLRLEALATAVRFQALHERLGGLGAARLSIRGTFDDPVAKGRVEVYGGSIADVPLQVDGQPKDLELPLLVADVSFDRRRATFESIQGSKGAAWIQGQGSWEFESGALDGVLQASGVDLAEFAPDDVFGSVAVPVARVSGTVENPRIEAQAEGRDVVIRGIRVDSLAANGLLFGNLFQLHEALLTIEKGTLRATGSYDFGTKSGAFDGKVEDLAVERIVPLLPGEVTLAGLLRGDVSAKLQGGQIASLASGGGIDGLNVNRTLVGAGSWDLTLTEGAWSGSLEVGQLERFVRVPSFTYDPEKDVLDASVESYAVPVEDVFRIVRPYLSGERELMPGRSIALSPDLLASLDRIRGKLDLAATLHGATSDPELVVESASISNLLYAEAPAGRIDAVLKRSKRVWVLDSLTWKDGPGTFEATGAVEEHGSILVDGSLYNFDANWLSQFDARFAKLSGRVDLLSFRASGDTSSPLIEASLNGRLFVPEAKPVLPGSEAIAEARAEAQDFSLRLNLYEIVVKEGSATLEGGFDYRGLKGTILGELPFRYPLELPENEPLSFVVELPKRSVTELTDFVKGLDVQLTKGDLFASLTLSGTRTSAVIAGQFRLDAPLLALEGMRTALSEVTASVTFQRDRATVTARASGSEGGSLGLDAEIGLRDLERLLAGSVEELLDSTLRGSLKIDDFRARENRGPGGSADFVAGGAVAIGGTLRQPHLSTDEPIRIWSASAQAPGEIAEAAPLAGGMVNPRFDLDFLIGSDADPVRLRTGQGAFEIHGPGALRGTFVEPNLTASMSVKGGSIRLPNARILVESGGSARLAYQGALGEASTARLDVDLRGRTALTARRPDGLVGRYEIRLEIRGNLLEEGDMLILASADPPDLSQERILALLGQGEILESIGPQIGGGGLERGVQSALSSIALPLFLDPFTERLAREMGLDYLGLEYNAFEGATVTIAKTFGSGLALQYRRQVSEPVDNRTIFDLRLTYRPFTKSSFWRNVIFSVGADQDRPWKFTIEYGRRF